MRHLTLTLTLAAGISLGCAAQDDDSIVRLFDENGTGVAVQPNGAEGLPLPQRESALPKAETAQEQQDGKFDQFDVRGSYSDIFGITEPPVGQVRSLGEFEETGAVLIAWNQGLARFLVNLIALSLEHADVWVVTWNEAESNLVRRILDQNNIDTSALNFFEFPHESFWTRDFGPITVVDELGVPKFVDPRYYNERRRDDAIPTLMGRYFVTEVYRPAVATEGGNFMSNGEGICVVTNWFLQENPRLSAEQLQSIQVNYFGCDSTVVLQRLEGEGTGHVDMFAKFLSPNVLLLGEYDQYDPANAAILDANAERLERFAAERDWPLQIIRIPMPYGAGGVYRSYTNSLIATMP